MWVDGQSIILAGGILTAITAFVTLSWKVFKWINHQKEQDEEIKMLKIRHEQDIKDLQCKHEQDNHSTQSEQTIVIYGLLACLKGLQEKGCNGPVTEAIDKIEKHINKKAHQQ